MLISITTTHVPATDLGYLLHKNPARVHSRSTSGGRAHVFYPVATEDTCTAVLLVEIDPVALVRGRAGSRADTGLLDQYVNDRPYAASSFLSVALGEMFSTAMSGRCKDRPELAETALPCRVEIPVLPCRGGEDVLRRLFEPLHYALRVERLPLDPAYPEWGESRYYHVVLEAQKRLSDVLKHVYVLIPVLDDDKHYWVGEDEVAKLLRHGQGWLESHPDKEEIANRYLKRRKSLTRMALAQLIESTLEEVEETDAQGNAEEIEPEKPIRLNTIRHETVVAALKEGGAARILDLGCGEGKLIRNLLEDKQFTEIVGMDVSSRSLEFAAERLRLEQMPEKKRQRVRLMHGSLTYWDERLKGFDAACAVEVIEHLDPPRLAAFEQVAFACAHPGTMIVTTPNAEYNVLFPTLANGAFRHRDHRFEWTRAEFQAWANRVAEQHGYRVRFEPIGPVDDTHGAPTQMAVFEL